jgi:AraC-like DNA-binding protein
LPAANDPGTGLLFIRIRGSAPSQPAFETTSDDVVSVLVSPGEPSQMSCDRTPSPAPFTLDSESAIVVDLRQPPPLRFGERVDLIRADIPRSTLQTFARRHGWGDLPDIIETECGKRDATLSCLLGSLRPYFDGPRDGGALVVNQISMAVMAQILTAYPDPEGDHPAQRSHRVERGRLAAWQVLRVKKLIEGNLAAEISVAWLAEQCGLSPSYFARAFRESVGVPPYQWLIERRVSRSKELMKDRTRSLTDVALAAGFADQSHFSRAFARVTGMPPGVWRRSAPVS